MIRALFSAGSGMNAQQMSIDNIANNLANSSTTGFQQRQVNFTDLLYQNQIMPGSAATQQTTVSAGRWWRLVHVTRSRTTTRCCST